MFRWSNKSLSEALAKQVQRIEKLAYELPNHQKWLRENSVWAAAGELPLVAQLRQLADAIESLGVTLKLNRSGVAIASREVDRATAAVAQRASDELLAGN